jgi:NGP1NT (NUC091) domain
MVSKGQTGSGSKPRSSASSSVSLKKVKGENFYRDAKKVAKLKMLTGGKAVRDPDGNIIQAAAFQKGEDETKPGRVQPDRRWFGACSHFWILFSSFSEGMSREYASHFADGFGPFQDESGWEEG